MRRGRGGVMVSDVVSQGVLGSGVDEQAHEGRVVVSLS